MKKPVLFSVLTATPVFGFLGWLSLSTVEASKKNAEQDIQIAYNAKAAEASIKTNKMMCELVLGQEVSYDIKKKFCVGED